jgi:hypothetical protein
LAACRGRAPSQIKSLEFIPRVVSKGEANAMLKTTTHRRVALRTIGLYLDFSCLLLIVLGLSSCASQNPAEQINKFSQAATAITSQTQNSYQAVQDEYLKAQTYRVIANYDTQGFNPALLTPFLPPEALQVRIDVLQGLSAYAQGLASLASDDQITQFDNETKKLGAATYFARQGEAD